jgi:hypothetical protein
MLDSTRSRGIVPLRLQAIAGSAAMLAAIPGPPEDRFSFTQLPLAVGKSPTYHLSLWIKRWSARWKRRNTLSQVELETLVRAANYFRALRRPANCFTILCAGPDTRLSGLYNADTVPGACGIGRLIEREGALRLLEFYDPGQEEQCTQAIEGVVRDSMLA